MIYLDHAATSPPRREMLEAMWPFLTEAFANPASSHAYGRAAREGLETARAIVAETLGASANDIVLTSGGTEGNTLALTGLALGAPRGRRLIISAVEHEAVRQSAYWLRDHHGFVADVVPVDRYGVIKVDALAATLRPDTSVVSVMYANNEVGTVQPIAAISALCREFDVPLHVDAVQAVGQLPLDVDALGVDALTLSGHKFGGPRGTGVVCLRGTRPLVSPVVGGGQERGRRSGTVNVAGAAGLARALELAEAARSATVEREVGLRNTLIAGVLDAVPEAHLTGHPLERLANHASFVFPGLNGETLLEELEQAGIICSSGSACSSESDEASVVLGAMGFDDDTARSAVRFTLGPETTADDIDRVITAVPEAAARVHLLS